MARDLAEDVDLLGGGFPQLLHLLGGDVPRRDVDDLHGIFLPRGLVDAPPDHAAHPPARDNRGRKGGSSSLPARPPAPGAGWDFHAPAGLALSPCLGGTEGFELMESAVPCYF